MMPQMYYKAQDGTLIPMGKRGPKGDPGEPGPVGPEGPSGGMDLTAADARYVNVDGDTMTGNLGVGGGAADFGATSKNVKVQSGADGYASVIVSADGRELQMLANNANGVAAMGTRSNHELTICTNDTTRIRVGTDGTVTVRDKPVARVYTQATAPTGTTDGDLWVDTSPGGNIGAIGGSLGTFDQMPTWGEGAWRTFLSVVLNPVAFPFYVQAWARGELLGEAGSRWDMVVKAQDETKNIIMGVGLPYAESGSYMNTSMALLGPYPAGAQAAVMVGAQRPYGTGASRTAWNCQGAYLIVPAVR